MSRNHLREVRDSPMKKYQNKAWLKAKFIDENLTRNRVAEMAGVSSNTIRRYLRKFNITKDSKNIYRSRTTTEIPIKYVIDKCANCEDDAKIRREYYIRRVKENKSEFFCSKLCADIHHSERMKGEGNPNFRGVWHAQCPSEWAKEKREEATRKMIETVVREGTFRGEKNGRWRGGERIHNCVICDKETKVRPFEHRLIISGERKPCCSLSCVAALGRRNIRTEGTSIERAMASELSKRGIKYDEQFNLEDKFRPDFYLPKYNIIIECDGDYWHRLPDVVSRDKRKNAYYKERGYAVFRFWESEINESVEACVDIILAEINEKEAIT